MVEESVGHETLRPRWKQLMSNLERAPKMSDYLTEESKAYFQAVLDGLDALGIPYEIEDTLVRGLDYYTHTVFEIVSENKEMGASVMLFEIIFEFHLH